MTKTDKPYLVEHDQMMTTTNVHLLNMTENDWIWPKIKNNCKQFHNDEHVLLNMTKNFK